MGSLTSMGNLGVLKSLQSLTGQMSQHPLGGVPPRKRQKRKSSPAALVRSESPQTLSGMIAVLGLCIVLELHSDVILFVLHSIVYPSLLWCLIPHISSAHCSICFLAWLLPIVCFLVLYYRLGWREPLNSSNKDMQRGKYWCQTECLLLCAMLSSLKDNFDTWHCLAFSC